MTAAFDFLDRLDEAGARWLVFGSAAMRAYGWPVDQVNDLDILTGFDRSNAESITSAIRAIGVTDPRMNAELLASRHRSCRLKFKTGEFCQVDIVGEMGGVRFDDAWLRRVSMPIAGRMLPTICRNDFAAIKIASSKQRHRDMASWLSNMPSPGTNLRKLIEWFPVPKKKGCQSCRNLELKMNRWGVETCRQKMPYILRKLKVAAKRRGLPFSERLVRILVERAING